MFDREEEMDRYLDEIKDMLRRKQYAAVRDLLLPLEPPDIAMLLEESGEEFMPLLYRLLPKELAAEVFVELESDSQEMLINGFSNTELKEVLDELYLDDAVDIVEEMPASVVIRILDKATPEMRKSINEMLQYPEDSAGSIMNVEYLSLKKDMTVADAFKRIRRIGGELETINILYVTDPTRHLQGVLSVRDLLLADEDDRIEEIMDPNVVSATFTGLIITSFENSLAVLPVLTAYIPMLMDTGGNCGSQSSVTVIRALSLSEVNFSDTFQIIWKELRVALLCGVCLAVANFVKMMLVDRLLLGNTALSPLIAAVVCGTLVCTVLCAKFVGCTLPLLAKKIGLDPAVMASPFITTIVDALSLLIYFAFSKSLLGV